MNFTKMEGCGNDYVYVDCTKKPLNNPSAVAVQVSDRHFGIGSDGLILIKPSDKADFFMEMYNSDGSQAQMCGNGIRCVGKFVYDKGLTAKTQISVDTLAGIKYLDLNVVNGKVCSVKVNMGSPVLEAEKIPVKAAKSPVVRERITVAGKDYEMTCVSMGNPHAVVYVDSTDDLLIEAVGPLFEKHEKFPEKTNTEFVEVIDRKTLKMRVWERGAGETLACGTGACATLVASVLNGLCENEATIKLLGGDLKITWDRENDLIFMEGPARTVFEGIIEID